MRRARVERSAVGTTMKQTTSWGLHRAAVRWVWSILLEWSRQTLWEVVQVL